LILVVEKEKKGMMIWILLDLKIPVPFFELAFPNHNPSPQLK